MQLVGENLWIARKDFRVPAFGNLGGCATIIAYEPGKLMIVSPVNFDKSELDAIAAMGEVRYLISPNPVHHIHLPRTKDRFPKALVAGPPRSALKQEDVDFDLILTEGTKFPWAATVDTIRVKARPPLDEEYIFYHRVSRTVVITDFMFNVHNAGGAWNRFWLKLNGADRKLAMSRFGKLMYHPESTRETVEKILAWNPENLVVCHGEPVLGGAAPRIRESFREILS